MKPYLQQMALLLASKNFPHLRGHAEFIKDHGCALWRTRGRNTTSLEDIPWPLHLYFFHRNTVRYRCRCLKINRDKNYSIEDVIPRYRGDSEPFTLFIYFDTLVQVEDTRISEFPKWKNPKDFFRQGLLGLQKVYDLPIPVVDHCSP